MEREVIAKKKSPLFPPGKWSRDAVLFSVSVSMLVYEIIIGGARPAVLSLLTGLLLSPVVLRLDEQRRKDNGH